MTYQSKRDTLLVASAILGTVVLFGSAGCLVGLAFYEHQPLLLLPALFVAVIGGMLVWMLMSAAYEITEITLAIRFGPFRWSIPIESITDVYATRRIPLKPGWGLAWSFDRLLIKCRDRFLVFGISPVDKTAFLAELGRARPGLKVTEC
jgi:hypothetical protein